VPADGFRIAAYFLGYLLEGKEMGLPIAIRLDHGR
jgi:hypothetical protein